MGANVGWIQQNIPVRFIVREDIVVIRKSEGIKLSKLKNKVTVNVRYDSTFLDHMKTILNFSPIFKKKYDEKIFATGIVDKAKDMIAFDLLAEMSAQSYYRYFLVAKMMLTHEGFFALIESLNGDDAGSKSLDISHLHDIGLYTATTKEPLILISTASNFVKNPNTPAFFHVRTFYSSAKTFLGKLRTIFFNHLSDSASECFESLNKPTYHTRTTRIPLLQMFLSLCVCTDMT